MGTRFGVELRFYGDLGCAARWIAMARMGGGDPVAVHMPMQGASLQAVSAMPQRHVRNRARGIIAVLA